MTSWDRARHALIQAIVEQGDEADPDLTEALDYLTEAFLNLDQNASDEECLTIVYFTALITPHKAIATPAA